MGRALVLLAALLVTAPAHAQVPDGTATHVVLGTYAVAAFVDISATEYGIGTGNFRETNPAFRWAVNRGPTTAGIVKGSAHTVIVWWLLRQHKGHPTRTFWVSLALASAQVAVDVQNARTIGRGGQ
jgi:hypothetical protein